MKRKCYIPLAMLCIMLSICSLSLCACQKNPERTSVISKAENSFDVYGVISDTAHKDPSSSQQVQYVNSFSSTDGSVEFVLDIDKSISSADMPLVEVSIHYPTAEEAKRIATSLFGSSTFYELEPRLSPVLSKDDILERINRWSNYTNTAAVHELFGSEKNGCADLVQRFIENYTAMYENAPDGNPHKLCEWKYKNGAHYWYPEAELAEVNTDEFNDEIQATLTFDGIPYLFCTSIHKGDLYQVSSIAAYPYTGTSPDNIDEHIYRSMLLRTEKPTTGQLTQVAAIAERMLKEMDLGQWQIVQCNVETQYYGQIPEYKICITAAPVFGGIAATRAEGVSITESYSYAWNMTKAVFEFSADGKLYFFNMISPLDISSTINDNVKTISIDTLMIRAKEHLELSDKYQYGTPQEIEAARAMGIDLKCTVKITDLDYALARVPVRDTDQYCYYVPSLTLYGNVEYSDIENGDIYFVNQDIVLLTLNAVDGTIIWGIND